MTIEQWRKALVLLGEALELQGEARTAFVRQHCEGDEEIEEEVDALLRLEPKMGGFIETPVFQILPDDLKPLAEGYRIGIYRILREIGRGGMANVYLAKQDDNELVEQYVAVKLIRHGIDTEEIVHRFRFEFQILSRLNHPNIARFLDSGTTGEGQPYFVMEYVEGRPIDEYCDDRDLSTEQRLELFQKVCSAVHFAHQNLVVHSDLKPGNILVTSAGIPKLLDFGIARLLDQDPLPSLVKATLRPMTPEYASPEQIRGEAITTASDIYSLGVLLYKLLTGHIPTMTKPDNGHYGVVAGRGHPPQPIRELDSLKEPQGCKGKRILKYVGWPGRCGAVSSRQIAAELKSIILMAMNDEPNLRYASVRQFSEDIGRYLSSLPVRAHKDSVRYRVAKFFGRHRNRMRSLISNNYRQYEQGLWRVK